MTALNFDSEGTFTGNFSSRDFTAEVEAQSMASALARIGWLIRPNTMLYGLAGWTFAHFDTDNQFLGVTSFDADELSVGTGIEKKIGPDWSIRAEYRFTDFGETDERFNRNGDDPIDARRGVDSFDNKMHIGRIGIARKLGRSEPSAETLK